MESCNVAMGCLQVTTVPLQRTTYHRSSGPITTLLTTLNVVHNLTKTNTTTNNPKNDSVGDVAMDSSWIRWVTPASLVLMVSLVKNVTHPVYTLAMEGTVISFVIVQRNFVMYQWDVCELQLFHYIRPPITGALDHVPYWQQWQSSTKQIWTWL